MPGAGDTASNCGGPWLHTNPAGVVLDVRVGFHYLPMTGSGWVSPPPIPVSTYATIHAANRQSGAAFEAAVAASPWQPWYAACYGTDPDARLAFRKLVETVEPRASVAPVGVPT